MYGDFVYLLSMQVKTSLLVVLYEKYINYKYRKTTVVCPVLYTRKQDGLYSFYCVCCHQCYLRNLVVSIEENKLSLRKFTLLTIKLQLHCLNFLNTLVSINFTKSLLSFASIHLLTLLTYYVSTKA